MGKKDISFQFWGLWLLLFSASPACAFCLLFCNFVILHSVIGVGRLALFWSGFGWLLVTLILLQAVSLLAFCSQAGLPRSFTRETEYMKTSPAETGLYLGLDLEIPWEIKNVEN
jgi:hypothetical protein